MARYVFGGSSRLVGRFGFLTTGDVVDLTAAEALAVAGDANWFAEPTAATKEIVLSGTSLTLVNGDSGKLIRLNHSGAAIITLPASPSIGTKYEFLFGTGTADVTFEPGETNSIVGQATDKKVLSITITNGGSGYLTPPTVGFTGGAGAGAAGTAVLTADAVTSVTITAGGQGYTSAPTVGFTGGSGTGAAGTAVLSVIPGNLVVAATAGRIGLYWNGANWATI